MIDQLTTTPKTTQVGPLASSGHKLRLLVIGDGVYTSHPLPESGEIGVGRDPQNDICIEHNSVSRFHAILHIGAALSIRDVGSANGTRVQNNVLATNEKATIGIDEVFDVGDAMVVIQRRSTSTQPRRPRTHSYFTTRLEEECARAERDGATFAVLRIRFPPDVDHAALECTLFSALRTIDIVGSYGPTEYEVLIPNACAETIERTSTRLRSKLAIHAESVALGYALYPLHGQDPTTLIERAREAGLDKGQLTPARQSIVVIDPAMRSLHRLVDRIAVGDISVLLLGETGVGKEVFAETIHGRSGRSKNPFLRLNCAALSPTLLESELFGHERGAFTGAVAAKKGLLETAGSGTVFLDEIGEMPLALQSKLLRVIEERQVLRVGGLKSQPIDVRFIAATNRDLEAQVRIGAFRQDLYFRLNGITLVIPPLRERVSEIETLAVEFVARAAEEIGRSAPPLLSAETLELLQRYSWPGNIRELRNVISRAVLLSTGGVVHPADLPEKKMRAEPVDNDYSLETSIDDETVRVSTVDSRTVAEAAHRNQSESVATFADAKRDLEAREKRLIEEALNRAAGNQTAAAKALGIARRTLLKRLDKYGIARPRKGRK